MATQEEKRLARSIKKMIDKGLDLSRQPDGSFTAKFEGKVYIRMRAKEAKKACNDGLLSESVDGNLLLSTPITRKWLARHQAYDGEDNIFAAQHRVMQTVSLIDAHGHIHQARRNTAQSPLDRLRRHTGPDNCPFLSLEQYAAGERLREDYFRSSLAQKLCADWSAPTHSTKSQGSHNAVLDAADNALAAKDRFMCALQALGPGLNDLVFWLCIREVSIEAIERTQKWPKRSAKIVLKLALDRLVLHYGLLN